MKITQIVICVEGGVVQTVYSNQLNTRVEVVDYDNLEVQGKTRQQATTIGKQATDGLECIYG